MQAGMYDIECQGYRDKAGLKGEQKAVPNLD